MVVDIVIYLGMGILLFGYEKFIDYDGGFGLACGGYACFLR